MLLNIVEFAAKCGVSRQAIYKAVRVGAINLKSNNEIDTEDPLNQAYLNKRKKTVGDSPQENLVQPAAIITAPPREGSKTFYETERLKQDIIAKKFKNLKEAGKLLPRDLVLKYFVEPVNTAHLRMLTDGARSIVAQIAPLSKSGASTEEMEALTKKIISSFIKAFKAEVGKLLDEHKYTAPTG
jgi:hypothetical protein